MALGIPLDSVFCGERMGQVEATSFYWKRESGDLKEHMGSNATCSARLFDRAFVLVWAGRCRAERE